MGDNVDNNAFTDAAELQGEYNQQVNTDQTYANRANQSNHLGFTNWEASPYTDPGTGLQTTKWNQTSGLTPELQELWNKQVALNTGKTDIAGGLQNRMASEFGQEMNWDGLNPLAETPMGQYTLPESYEGIAGIGDPTEMRGRAENAYYDKGMSRLQPKFDSQREAMEIKLRNQGLSPEDAQYKSQMEGLGQQETDAYGQLQYDATRAGLGEQNQLWNQGMGARQQGVGEANSQFGQALSSNAQNYGQNMQGANYANQLRQQQMTEAMQQRGFSLNEINALLSGGQVQTPQMPNFNTAQRAEPAPIYQGTVDQTNANAAANPMNDIMNLAGTLGGAAIGTMGP